ncbi:hypothetical protein [Nocardioides taihuensis]|uniref:Uncharacterized protein n=1 Tax=Nocardioides taihuensis TaxID=1835606 RepID=A0ABW0BGV2_9ACTN
MPRVTQIRFRNSGTSDADNTCAICPVDLGVGPGARAVNGMELRFRIEGHRAGLEYDITRTRRDSLWQRVGGVWTQLGTNPMGTNDDHHDQDEALTPAAASSTRSTGPGIPISCCRRPPRHWEAAWCGRAP